MYALRTRMRTRTTPLTHVYTRMLYYGVVQCLPMKSPTIYRGRRNLRREKNDRDDDDDDDEEYDDTKIEKLRMSGFSRGKPEAGRNELGLCTARYESKSCC